MRFKPYRSTEKSVKTSIGCFYNMQKPTQRVMEMKKQRNMSQTNDQDKYPANKYQ